MYLQISLESNLIISKRCSFYILFCNENNYYALFWNKFYVENILLITYMVKTCRCVYRIPVDGHLSFELARSCPSLNCTCWWRLVKDRSKTCHTEWKTGRLLSCGRSFSQLKKIQLLIWIKYLVSMINFMIYVFEVEHFYNSWFPKKNRCVRGSHSVRIWLQKWTRVLIHFRT